MSTPSFTFTGHLTSGPSDLVPAKGKVKIWAVDGDGARITVKDTTADTVFDSVLIVPLDTDGSWEVDLVDPWGAGVSPQGFGYAVQPTPTTGSRTPILFAVDEGTVTLDYADVVEAAAHPLDPSGLELAKAYTTEQIAALTIIGGTA